MKAQTDTTSSSKHQGDLSLVFAGTLALLGVAVIFVAGVNQQSVPVVRSNSSVVASEPALTTSNLEQKKLLQRSEPTAITIPSIAVSSNLSTIGIRPDGTLEVPNGQNYDTAAWYRNSVTPGEAGPTIIVGHIDSVESGPSVFFKLAELKPGDEVVIERKDASIVTYRIDSLYEFPKDSFPTEAVYGPTDMPTLRLITCSGNYDAVSGTYEKNVVAFGSIK